MATMADLGAADAALGWDRQTYMPQGGVEGRAEQLSTLSRLSHEMLVSEETRSLLDSVEEPEQGSVEAAVLRRTRREYDKATKLPGRLVGDISRQTALAQSAWVGARENSDWGAFLPYLEKILDLEREAAEHLGYEDHPYDALLDDYEPGAKKEKLQQMFDELKSAAVPMLRDIAAATDEDRTAPLHGDFDEDRQEEFGRAVISRFGYDFKRGRQDRVVHPFCVPIGGPGDVRITTRFDPTWLSPALFATMHESGHAMYEQGVDPSYSRTSLASGVSMGVHESQSRLWENLVGRSRGFWSHYYPGLQEAFPEALGNVSLEKFYRAANAVAPSEIRVEADEVTYNLHILIRFELEVALIEDNLSVADLPEAWNAKTEEYLGFTPKNDARGVLQDVHWAAGLFGYFPTYTIGNVLSVQIFESAVEAHPEIPEEIARGEFATLLGWLRENIHRHGSRYEPEELIERATGRPTETAPYLNYLKDKFGELYDLG
ncbi:MAG: carboxypeptidase M32 [Rubrobacteraceae bacterium]